MRKNKKQKLRQETAANNENALQKGYMFAGLMLLAVIAVVLVSAAVHRNKLGQPVITKGKDYVAEHLTVWSGAGAPSPYTFLYAQTSEQVSAARYSSVPDLSVGDHNVAIMIQLKDGTTRTENAVLTVADPVMHMEVGTVANAEQLLGRPFADAVITPPVSEFTEVGSYPVTVTKNGTSLPFTLVVQDTTPPTAVLKENLSFYVNQKLTYEDFVVSCSDMSPVDYHFSENPSTYTQGTYQIQLIITDSAGNSQTYDIPYEVSGDGEAPKIQGLTMMQTVAGIPIDYLRGVKAIDSGDGQVEVTAQEPAGFDIRVPGSYEITYSATDSAGNIASETAQLVVLSENDNFSQLQSEDVFRMGDAIIKTLSISNNRDDEQTFARAIFDYVQGHMQYVNGSNTDDWQQAAVSALLLGYGDSANYYGLSRLLLTCAGYENMMVERQSAQEIAAGDEEGDEKKTAKWYAPHFWNLVRVNGAWYHFDTAPYYGGSDFFLWTDAQIDYFSSQNGNCFERDKSLYPSTPH